MRLNVIKQFEFLQTVNETYWIDLLKEYLIDVSIHKLINNNIDAIYENSF